MWANGVERFCYRRVVKGGQVLIEEVPDIPSLARTRKAQMLLGQVNLRETVLSEAVLS